MALVLKGSTICSEARWPHRTSPPAPQGGSESSAAVGAGCMSHSQNPFYRALIATVLEIMYIVLIYLSGHLFLFAFIFIFICLEYIFITRKRSFVLGSHGSLLRIHLDFKPSKAQSRSLGSGLKSVVELRLTEAELVDLMDRTRHSRLQNIGTWM